MRSKIAGVILVQLLGCLLFLVPVRGAFQCPEWPAQATRNLNKPELSGCSCDQLDKLRNEIYARHGRKFKRKDLQSYFESQSWYKYDPANPTGSKGQNKFEKRNGAFILKLEKEMGCRGISRLDSGCGCDEMEESSGCPVWPAQAGRNLNKNDISGCDCDQLDKLRNEIYARHGRKFKRKDLQGYFESQAWYRYDPNNQDGNKGQNKYERRNADFILKVENERGCRGD